MGASYIVWGAWILLFVVLEFLGLFHVVPWRTLSETAWSLEALSSWIKVLVLAGFVVLTCHICFHFPR